ncbi:chemotaxis protein CheX [Azoarcus sp. DN11]|uniref:chemotaxis protein CheX n=1 Tax=Azoarcus sp. DN11 TaxID=356837 RepID=UPI001C2BE1BC|nr:chemotaxis protein CheX [Azoarcus sp. DN11]
MNDDRESMHKLVSKVLVLDDASTYVGSLKAFCEECGLVGIRANQGGETGLMAVLRANVDLGGIMLYENFGGDLDRTLALARQIHALRPELPVFLRRQSVASVAGLAEKDAAMFRCAYTLADLQQLKATLDDSIFSRFYPNDLVRGISEITRASLEALFRHCEVDVETPYLVKDRIIYGEVFTMITIESGWCRGYMMMQACEYAVIGLIRGGRDGAEAATFRDLNQVLGEATNLIWGGFKNRYVGQSRAPDATMQTQVPIVINHHRRYISFGSDEPQLCLKYTLRDRSRPEAPSVPIYQRFIFNLCWAPDEFRENPSVESFVDSGELELF